MGLVGLDAIDASAELSFLLHERFWGQGYATEAAAKHPATLNPLPRQSEAMAGQPSTLNLCKKELARQWREQTTMPLALSRLRQALTSIQRISPSAVRITNIIG